MDIFGETVNGNDVDAQTRCAHYHREVDIIAIKFKCCGEWFPCFECHSEIAKHQAEVWKADNFDEKAILCGVCGYQLKIEEYLNSDSICPNCQSGFNPNCAKHYDLYFEIS